MTVLYVVIHPGYSECLLVLTPVLRQRPHPLVYSPAGSGSCRDREYPEKKKKAFTPHAKAFAD